MNSSRDAFHASLLQWEFTDFEPTESFDWLRKFVAVAVIASVATELSSDIVEQMATRQLSIIFLTPNIVRPCPFLPITMSPLPPFSDSICIPRCASTSIALLLVPFSLGLAWLFETFGLLGRPCPTWALGWSHCVHGFERMCRPRLVVVYSPGSPYFTFRVSSLFCWPESLVFQSCRIADYEGCRPAAPSSDKISH